MHAHMTVKSLWIKACAETAYIIWLWRHSPGSQTLRNSIYCYNGGFIFIWSHTGPLSCQSSCGSLQQNKMRCSGWQQKRSLNMVVVWHTLCITCHTEMIQWSRTLSGQHSDGYAGVAELDEGSSLTVHSVSGQQDVLGTHKAMHQLLILLHARTHTHTRERVTSNLIVFVTCAEYNRCSRDYREMLPYETLPTMQSFFLLYPKRNKIDRVHTGSASTRSMWRSTRYLR